jgi:hypothetical protein
LASASSSGHASGSGEIAAAAYLSVTENYFAHATAALGQGPLRFAVTDQRTIARLAALIDSLPTAPDQVMSPCPSSMAPAYGLEFRDAKDTAPVAEVSMMCFGVMVTVQGHGEPILSYPTSPSGEASFLSSVSSLLSASTPGAGNSVASPSSSSTRQ